MSQVDTTFGSIPGPLVGKWGQTVTFLKAGGPATYNPATGNISATTTSYTGRGVITKVHATELNGVLQSTDYKVITEPGQIGGNYVTTADSFKFTRGNKTINAKVIDVATYAGDAPIMFICFVRPQ
jgi:hypothetical protein